MDESSNSAHAGGFVRGRYSFGDPGQGAGDGRVGGPKCEHGHAVTLSDVLTHTAPAHSHADVSDVCYRTDGR